MVCNDKVGGDVFPLYGQFVSCILDLVVGKIILVQGDVIILSCDIIWSMGEFVL